MTIEHTPRAVHITSFLNRRGDIEASITRNARGLYVVTIIDADCGEILAVARMYHLYGDAQAYALTCVSDDDEELPL